VCCDSAAAHVYTVDGHILEAWVLFLRSPTKTLTLANRVHISSSATLLPVGRKIK
jgi:hypothetical protein